MTRQPSIADLAIGRSTIRRRILVLLLADPDTRLHLRDVQRRAGTTPGTASRELAALVAAGLIEREPQGQHVFFRASRSPFAEMLRPLLAADGLAPKAPTAPRDDTAEPPAGTTKPPTSPALDEPPTDPTAPPPVQDLQVPAVIDPARLAPEHVEIAARFAAAMRDAFGDDLVEVLIDRPGPSAAAQSQPLSFIVVLDEAPPYGEALERTSRQTFGLSIESGVVVSRIFVGRSEWVHREDGFFVRARSEAVPVE